MTDDGNSLENTEWDDSSAQTCVRGAIQGFDIDISGKHLDWREAADLAYKPDDLLFHCSSDAFI